MEQDTEPSVLLLSRFREFAMLRQLVRAEVSEVSIPIL
jgi:hypothetical protein